MFFKSSTGELQGSRQEILGEGEIMLMVTVFSHGFVFLQQTFRILEWDFFIKGRGKDIKKLNILIF